MTILGADIKQVSRSLASALPPSIVPAAPTLAAELLRSVGEIEQALNAIVADHPCRPSRAGGNQERAVRVRLPPRPEPRRYHRRCNSAPGPCERTALIVTLNTQPDAAAGKDQVLNADGGGRRCDGPVVMGRRALG